MKPSELRQLIKECVKTIINESVDMYDPEGDVSRYEPRDRTEQSNSLNIPEYPKSIIKPVNMDGKQQFFVYSDSTNTALILGYGDNKNTAIENAKKVASYIKNGGVGHNADLSEEGIDPYFMKDEGEENIAVMHWIKNRLSTESDPNNINALNTVMRLVTSTSTAVK